MDSNLAFQQNLGSSNLFIIVLRAVNSRYETLQPLIPDIVKVLNTPVESGALIAVG